MESGLDLLSPVGFDIRLGLFRTAGGDDECWELAEAEYEGGSITPVAWLGVM